MSVSLTILIITTTCAVSIPAFFRRESIFKLGYSPHQVVYRKEWFRLVSHAFIHTDFIHLFVNMWVLYAFGRSVEANYLLFFENHGKLFYFLLYLGGIFFSSLPAISKHKNNPSYIAVGASGAVSAILFAGILFMPRAEVFLLFIPIGIPAFVFGILYLVYEAYMDKHAKDNVAHDAHFWGALFGIIFTLLLNPSIGLHFLEQIF